MNGGISAPFIRYPVATTLLMLGIFCVGLVAYPLLPVAPLPQVDFPTIQVSATLPGGSPRHDGVVGRATIGTPIRPDPRRVAVDLHIVAGLYRDHDPVRSRSQHRRRRQRRAGRHQRGFGPVAEKSSDPADLEESQPGRLADHAPIGDLGSSAPHGRGRQCRREDRAADQPDLGRVPGDHRRRAETVDPRADRSREAGHQRVVARRRAQRHVDHHGG